MATLDRGNARTCKRKRCYCNVMEGNQLCEDCMDEWVNIAWKNIDKVTNVDKDWAIFLDNEDETDE